MTVTLFVLLLADVVFAAAGPLHLKKGMLILGPLEFSFRNVPPLIFAVLRSWHILLALFFYGVAFLIWLFILSKAKLSLAYPALSIMYVFVIAGSWVFFRESISGTQIIAMLLILTGFIVLVQVR